MNLTRPRARRGTPTRSNTTPDLVVDDWRMIRRALTHYMQTMTARNAWTAAAAAQAVQNKITDQNLAERP